MKQVWPNYSYSPTTNVLTLTGLNIDRDQLLLVTAADRGRIMYNFADSTTTASAFTAGANTGLTLVASTAGLTTTAALVIYYDDQVAGSGTVNAVFNSGYVDGMDLLQQVNVCGTVNNLPPISGTVTVGNTVSFISVAGDDELTANISNAIQGSPLPAGTNSIGVVTVGNTVTIAGTVTANPTGTQTIAGSVTIGAGTAQIGSVTASISNTVVTSYTAQGTSVTNTTFTSITASTTLVSAVVGRDCLTVFNEGAGNLHISPGATATTISYQVRLSAGDYWECPAGQLSLAHTAVFATAGTARVTEVS
jgi:hypothetical protein